MDGRGRPPGRAADAAAHRGPAVPATPIPTSRACATRSAGTSCASPAPRWSSPSAAAVRPPALGALLVRHHRAAQADRARAGRDAARAAQEDAPAPRRAGGRPRLLVHHDRLDDVELPRRRAPHARLDRPLRRQPGPPRPRRALGPRAGDGRDLLRHERRLHLQLHEAGVEPRPRAATCRRCGRSAPPARRSRPRASTGSTSTSGPTPGCSPPAAARTCARRSSAGSPPCPSTRASCRPAPLGAKVEAWDEEGRSLVDEVGELVITEPHASMPICFWGDADGERYRESYFSMYPGVWRHGDWIEITDRGTGDHLRPLGLDDQPRRRPDGDERDLPRRARASTRSPTRSSSTSPRPGTEGWMPLFVVLADGAALDDDLVKRIAAAHPRRTARRATCPTRSARSPRCRGRCRGRCSRCRSSASSWARRPTQAASRDSLANPEALDWFVAFAARQ